MRNVELRQLRFRHISAVAIAFGALLSLTSCAFQQPGYWSQSSPTPAPDPLAIPAQADRPAATGQSDTSRTATAASANAGDPDTNRVGTADSLPAGAPEAGQTDGSAGVGLHDSDGDGIADLHDHCRNTPARAQVDAMGCPLDEDGDGVFDGIDQCSGTPNVAGLVVDSLGCPIDDDGDGIVTYLDQCPGTPSGVSVTADGCPTDTDEDGVPDYLDRCPGTLAGAKVEATGCPPDTDGDGIADSDDLCPGTPRELDVDSTGCLEMTQLDRRLVLHVNYVPGTTNPDPMSLRILNDLAIRLSRAPGLFATVEGFTDNIGLDSANLAVSQKRADKIAQYLIEKGVDANQVEAYGRGETNFIADNENAAGRRKNRRIEISFRSVEN